MELATNFCFANEQDANDVKVTPTTHPPARHQKHQIMETPVTLQAMTSNDQSNHCNICHFLWKQNVQDSSLEQTERMIRVYPSSWSNSGMVDEQASTLALFKNLNEGCYHNLCFGKI